MIRVTIEIIPHGVESKAQTLHVMEISNDGTGDRSTGNYDVWMSHTTDSGGYLNNLRHHRFDRDRGALALVSECLHKMTEMRFD